MAAPKKVFIVPYRNRPQQKFFFSKHMSFILENETDYEIYFSHQCDARTFNRGAAKDIGFLAVKNKYPNHYKDITFIFNDIDTVPFHKIIDYETVPGVVKHYYGFKFALGGIVVMKGGDFERLNGFPCFWGWGMEDNALQKRCDAVRITVDRSVFYPIGSPEIIQLFDAISRTISKRDPWRGEYDNGIDGLRTITNLKYTIDSTSSNPNDNNYTIENERIKYVNISTFLTHIPFGLDEYHDYDLRGPKRRLIRPEKIPGAPNSPIVNITDWSGIPFNPTTKETRSNVAQYFLMLGKQIPESLMKQISEDNASSAGIHINQQIQYVPVYGYNANPQVQGQIRGQQMLHQQQSPIRNNQPPIRPNQPPIRPNQPPIRPNQPPPHKYSQQYASYIGAKPRAQASVKIRLGGAY